MPYINMLEAKSSLSQLVLDIEQGRSTEIIIARHGHPVAKLVPMDYTAVSDKRIGIAKGMFVVPTSIDEHNEEVAALFSGVVP
jgi:antitoxin (DNA-binding transcriptional repressor) of toxin-antitoxin stability system